MDKTQTIFVIVTIIFVILLLIIYWKVNQIYALLQTYSKQAELFCNSKTKQQTQERPSEQIKFSSPNNKNKLILYYADWCGYSKQFKPIWDQFTKNTKLDINTEIVNCDTNKDLCETVNIRGFPTIILHKKDGKKIEYSGNRTIEDLEKFVGQNSV